ncbi:DUF4255 domain-containing protein [Nordella sp. HKS 07]|uniref:DUF4255 domain-containing protein n=1 Tax=Nordella sp. HKS 07 TaxID=2712222 RepID=UPI0013E18F3C|nr:DUF4255 domain-containing protein [Nordella sp. HKS 07]QIG49839.1 DUF4255 domain-containing protein [Nordella sp. HKS 07]
MASHAAIAAVSRTLRTLLRDRMVTGAEITLAPPDVELAGVSGARVNLYLMQVIENAALKNQEIPGAGHPAAYGHPPLSLDLRYLMTTHSAVENQRDADLNAQTLLGDAMRVMNDFANGIDRLLIVNPVAGTPGDPILDPDLTNEFERLRFVLHPATLDDITKVWSAVSGTNFRRSVVYEIKVVQIETPLPRVSPKPVEIRRVHMSLRRRPVITDLYVSPVNPGDPLGEMRARIGEEITIVAERVAADRLYVRLGSLDPIRVALPGDGRIRITLPDASYPIDGDNPTTRPIPPIQQLQPGPLEVQLIAFHPGEGVEGGLGPGSAIATSRRYASDIRLMQLVPTVVDAIPPVGNAASLLRVTGERLWHPAARGAEVIVGDAAIPVRMPEPGDPWAAPTPTAVEVPIVVATDILDVSATPYPVAAQVDGARSRDVGVTFTLGP